MKISMGVACGLLVWTTAASAQTAPANAAGDAIRPLTIITRPQAATPQEYQSAEMLAEAWKELGLQVTLRPMPTTQQTQVVWYDRKSWDATMWSMVGRPERSDPDEFTFNLFNSAYAASGYDFIGYDNPAYDKLALEQRGELDITKRQALIRASQELINHDQPYGFLVYPNNLEAMNVALFDEKTAVTQAGLGIRNFWTWLSLTPTGSQHDIILNSTAASGVLNPFYIPGAQGSWVTELIWDRLMRVGPDGLPKPWAAETVTRPTPTTVELTLRDGMTFHDGSPVTVDDVIFSLETPGVGDKAPMYKPFVANIANIEATGPKSLRITLKRPDAAFLVTTLSKLNIAPKKVWDPILQSIKDKPDNLETQQEAKPLGSGPYRFVSARLSEEIVLEANPDYWAKPNAGRWIMRVMPNIEATMGALKRGEINFLSDYTGDPQLLKDLVKSTPSIHMVEAPDIGFIFLAYNERRPPFNDVAFRQAMSAAIDREGIVADAWGGQAEPANSAISPALPFWHDEGIEKRVPGGDLEGAKKILKDAGYVVIDGKLHYPAGVKETTAPFQ